MKTIGELLKLSSEYLDSRRDAEELISNALRLKRLELYMQFDRPIAEDELHILREWVKRRKAKEPIEYILGEIEFYGCKIKVDSRALIPRPETELLVDIVAKKIEKAKIQTVWDICTGSGCIGIALKKKFPHLQITLSDICSKALSLAKENAHTNQVDLHFIQGDFLTPFSNQKADLIVSNPPYLTESEYVKLNSFEPKMAFIAGERGTEFYERFSLDYLNEPGWVFFEIGANQEVKLKKIFPNGETINDYAGHPRVFFLEKSN